MKFINLYKTVMTRIDYQLRLFEAVEEKYFHQLVKDDTWSPDAIFRHILWALNGLTKMSDKDAFELEVQPMVTGAKLEANINIKDVRNALDKIDEHLSTNLAELTEEELKVEKTTFFGTKTTLEGQLTSSLLHITEHVGELRWQFKRLTGWTDNQVYSLKS